MIDRLTALPLGTILDILLLVALAAMILSSALLYRRLAALGRDKEDMAQLLSDFSHATLRADHAVTGMKTAAGDTGEKLQDRIREGQALLDELNFILESGQNLADRLERDMGKLRPPEAAEKDAGEKTDEAGKKEDTYVPVSRAEKELMHAVGKSKSR